MFQGLKRKSCQTYSGMVPGDGKYTEIGVCTARQPVKIWCDPLGDRVFGERSHKGLKVSTKSCNSGNLSKGHSRPSRAQDRGSFSLTQTFSNLCIALNQYHLKARVGPLPQPSGSEQQSFSHWGMEIGLTPLFALCKHLRFWTHHGEGDSPKTEILDFLPISHSLKPWKFCVE